MSDISIGSLKDNFFDMDFVGKTAPIDIYRFTRTNTVSFRLSTEGFNGRLNPELLDSQGKSIKSITTDSSNQGTISIDNLGAADYFLTVSAITGETNYQISLTIDNKTDPLTVLVPSRD